MSSHHILRHLCLVGVAFLPTCSEADDSLGLVLSGGGAKGAYEAGVWSALSEAGLASRVGAISGTSIGSINGALFAAVQDPARIESIWLDEVNGILSINENVLAKFGTPEEREKEATTREANIAEDLRIEAKRRNVETNALPADVVSAIVERCCSVSAKKLLIRNGSRELFKSMAGFLNDGRADGFLATERLIAVAHSVLPDKWEDNAPSAYATALRKLPMSRFNRHVFSLKNAEPKSRIDMICASASIPVFLGTFEVCGVSYVDGGWESKGGDNVPIGPILDNHPDIKTVIVVFLDDARHLSSTRRDRVRNAAAVANVRLIEIVPSEDIGGVFGWAGVFDSSPETAKHLIELGRKDAREKLREAGLSD